MFYRVVTLPLYISANLSQFITQIVKWRYPLKKLLLATAIAALSVSAANAAPTVYGKAFLTLDYVSTDYDAANKTDEDTFKLNSKLPGITFVAPVPELRLDICKTLS